MDNLHNERFELGMIGLGTMGRNLLLNMADHGFEVSGFDVDSQRVDQLEKERKEKPVGAFRSLEELIHNLKSPKTVMMLVPAGMIVDQVIQELLPLLNKGDLIIDGGNSHFTDTNRRIAYSKELGIHFFGMGISGGEKGARYGPSFMPGGDKEAFEVINPILEAVAAKVNGEPCVTYVGPGASGHFVKTVHNGIEYGLMQLIAETYELLKKGLHLSNETIHQVFQTWNDGKLQSYLLEITRDIFAFKEAGADHILLDDIKDEAKAKGTGKWTSQIAMDLNLPIPVIDTAVSMRDLSKYKSLRTQLALKYPKKKSEFFSEEHTASFLPELQEAFYFSLITIYAQGMHLLEKASEEYSYNLQLDQIAKIWRGGCVIRSRFLDRIFVAFQEQPNLPHLFLDDYVHDELQKSLPHIQSVAISALSHGVAIPAYLSSLSYFDSLRSEKLPANLIQAQRDYFGSHSYERIGEEGIFHSRWEETVNT